MTTSYEYWSPTSSLIDGDTVTSENVMEILIGGLPEMNPTYPNEF